MIEVVIGLLVGAGIAIAVGSRNRSTLPEQTLPLEQNRGTFRGVRGSYWVEDDGWHYIDAKGIERRVVGKEI